MKIRISLVICALFIILSFSTQLLAQQNGEGNISGKVLDTNNEAAMYANIILHNPTDSAMVKGAVAGEDGAFQFVDVPFGKYFISTTYVGFAPYQSEILVLDQSNLNLSTIQLAEASNELAEITVTAQRPMFEMKSDKMVFNVDGTINASGDNALELLRKSPGVVLNNDDAITLLGKSGVKVYIDGKESPLSGDNLASFLRSLQAEQLDAIEIITNPTAEYDAEGSGGIINFRLKKDTSLGFNTGINLNYSRGENDRYSSSVNTNYRNQKFNVYGNYEIYKGANLSVLETYRETPTQILNTKNDMLDNWQGHDITVGVDWFLNEQNTVGVKVNGSKETETETADGGTELFQFMPNLDLTQATPDSMLVSSAEGDDKDGNLNFNLNYEFKDEAKNQLNIDLDAGFYEDTESRMLFNTYRNATDNTALSEFFYENNPDTDIQIYTAKADYKRPLFNGNFGAGIKLSLVNTDNVFSFLNVDETGKFLDYTKSNHFTYNENVNAAYFTYSNEKDKFTYNFGLRAEQTNLEGILMAFETDETLEKNKQSYLDLFPSASLSYQVNEKNAFSLSYSRRINRPNYHDLNPFEFKIDELTAEKGNPFLKSEYSNNVELRHSFMQMVNTTLAYSHTTNIITQMINANEAGTGIVVSNENMAQTNHFSLNIASPIPITEWWNGYTSITGYYVHTTADFGENKNIDLNAKSFNFYLQNTFTLPMDFSAELSGWYNSSGIWGNIQYKPQYGVDLGLQKKVLDGKGKIKLGVTDIFKSNKFRGTIEFDDLYSDVTSTWESHRYKVGFSYLFGNDGVKIRNRSTGSEAENNRIK